MAEQARAIRMTYAEYLELERTSSVKHEYVNGEAYAMGGGTPEHGRLAVAMGAILSESTEAADRGEKWAHYQRIPSLREYVLVSQGRASHRGVSSLRGTLGLRRAAGRRRHAPRLDRRDDRVERALSRSVRCVTRGFSDR